MLPSLINDDIDALMTNDKVFRTARLEKPDFAWRQSEDMTAALARTIVGQQLSTKAANTIWQRVREGLGEVTPQSIARTDDETLRGFGLSRQKISYLRGLGEAIENKTLRPETLKDHNDDDVLAAITALKGFGVWSAQMVMIFNLGRRDIWPAGDLGIREGVKLYAGFTERPTVAETEAFGDKFKGKRTAAALLLWKLKDAAIP